MKEFYAKYLTARTEQRIMSRDYDRDAAKDAWAEQEEERRMDEYYEQLDREHYECMRELEEEERLQELWEEEAAKPKYQKDDEYYANEDALDQQAEMEYKEQLKKYYDELALQQMLESEEKHMEWVVNDYYSENDIENSDKVET